MRDEFAEFLHVLESFGVAHCVVDIGVDGMELLLAESFDSRKRKFKGWKVMTDKNLYLYSLKPRLIYQSGQMSIYCNYKLACRSTLNGAWVPLDKCINDGVLERASYDQEKGFSVLSPEDEICYLLASCIYTMKQFAPKHREQISRCLENGNKEEIVRKLSKVFFFFTDRLLQLVKSGEYDEVIPALYAFAEY